MGIERPDARLGAHQRRRGRRLAVAPHRPHGRRHRVPAFAPAAPPDRAGKHQARAVARQAHAPVRRSADRRARPRHRRPRRPGPPCSTAGRRTLPFADLRKIEIAKAIARDPAGAADRRAVRRPHRQGDRGVLRSDLRTCATTAAPCCWSTTTSRASPRLVDRVIAMYVGERIAEGTADEVMRNETVRARLSRRHASRPPRARNPRSATRRRRSSRSTRSASTTARRRRSTDVSIHVARTRVRLPSSG